MPYGLNVLVLKCAMVGWAGDFVTLCFGSSAGTFCALWLFIFLHIEGNTAFGRGHNFTIKSHETFQNTFKSSVGLLHG